MPVTSIARAAPAPQTFVIGVDHADAANQQPFPPFNRLFEYTDFFTRDLRVHKGDSIDFQAAPGSFHIVALAKSEKVARSVYPVAFTDADGPASIDTAVGTGEPKIVLGPSNNSITGGSTHGGGTIANNPNGPPVCGVAVLGEAACTFKGGDDIEVIGPTPAFGLTGPAQVDQSVVINAQPGQYAFFCYIHPGMRGTLNVVDGDDPTSNQADLNQRAQDQFLADRLAALEVERRLNHVEVNDEERGERTFVVHVGAAAADDHVAIDEMLPNRPLSLAPGDRVRYVWRDPHNVHTVSFPAENPGLPGPFGFDCGTTFSGGSGGGPPVPCLELGDTHPEFIADPGNSPPGSVLTSPSTLVDSGVLIATGYHVQPSAQSWSVATRDSTAAGTYAFQCLVHDWMHGTLNVS